MAKLSIVNVDDEYPALQLINRYCSQIANVELMESFQNAQKALRYLKEHKVDLLVLDINMPNMSGIQLLQKLSYRPLCIFLTLEPQYAVQAFELDVVHYLVKPVSFESFNRAIDKARKFLQIRNLDSSKEEDNFIMFKSNNVINKIFLKDILWIQGCSEYIILVTPIKKYMALERLSHFEEKFRHLGFIRIHKSYIVLLSHIKSYDASHIYLITGDSLPFGRTYKASLKENLNK
ncbi:response regulator [Elizabethkingia argentiflava]|uniref:Response regulator n=1 Tax=Elizabethkingia argenteiflava TaxID=2681556 RepID=A0A845PYQ3_9FLAO|nr:LytTR family DNA-binding domain-containing protein [Elizabethkingia argenteiflava]NAW51946.1 response regulator [Elizabethkingia argenteiflava]